MALNNKLLSIFNRTIIYFQRAILSILFLKIKQLIVVLFSKKDGWFVQLVNLINHSIRYNYFGSVVIQEPTFQTPDIRTSEHQDMIL